MTLFCGREGSVHCMLTVSLVFCLVGSPGSIPGSGEVLMVFFGKTFPVAAPSLWGRDGRHRDEIGTSDTIDVIEDNM